MGRTSTAPIGIGTFVQTGKRTYIESDTGVGSGPKVSVRQASGSREPESVGVASPLNIGPLHPTALCSRQMMNTPLAMITAAPAKVRASGISVQNSQPNRVAQMMAV